MHHNDGPRARCERRAQAAEIHLPSVIVKQRVCHQPERPPVRREIPAADSSARAQALHRRVHIADERRGCTLHSFRTLARFAPGSRGRQRVQNFASQRSTPPQRRAFRRDPCFRACIRAREDRPAPREFRAPGKRIRRRLDSTRSSRATSFRSAGAPRARARSGSVRASNLSVMKTCVSIRACVPSMPAS